MWIYVPDCEPCPSVQEEGDLKQASSWPFPMLEQSAGLSGKLSARQSWCRAWKRDSWLKRLCGVISEPLAAESGVERWISSLRGSRASRSVKLAQDVVKTILGTCGPTFIELSKRYVPPSSFWKTSQGTLDLGLERSSEISTAQATELRRLSLQRRRLAQATNGSGCLSSEWRSPANAESGVKSEKIKNLNARNYDPETGRLMQFGLPQQSEQWQTPHGMANEDKTGKKGGAGGGEFAKQANQWATPRGLDRSPSSTEMENGDPKRRLECQSAIWPTPRSEDSESAGRRHSRDVDDTLTAACRSSPLAPTSESDGLKSSQSTPSSRRPQEWATPAAADNEGSTAGTTEKGGGRSLRKDASQFNQEKKRLNPRFVAWLMNWPPLEGDGFEPSETAWCRYRQRMRSHYLRLVCSEKVSKAT